MEREKREGEGGGIGKEDEMRKHEKDGMIKREKRK